MPQQRVGDERKVNCQWWGRGNYLSRMEGGGGEKDELSGMEHP